MCKHVLSSSLDIIYRKPLYDTFVYHSDKLALLIIRIPSINAICIFNTDDEFVSNIKRVNTKGFDSVYRKVSTYKICTVLHCHERDTNRTKMNVNLRNFIEDAVRDLATKMFTTREKINLNLVDMVSKIDNFINELIADFTKNVI